MTEQQRQLEIAHQAALATTAAVLDTYRLVLTGAFQTLAAKGCGCGDCSDPSKAANPTPDECFYKHLKHVTQTTSRIGSAVLAGPYASPPESKNDRLEDICDCLMSDADHENNPDHNAEGIPVWLLGVVQGDCPDRGNEGGDRISKKWWCQTIKILAKAMRECPGYDADLQKSTLKMIIWWGDKAKEPAQEPAR